MRIIPHLAGLLLASAIVVPAAAQERAVRLSHAALIQGQPAAAERMLVAEQRIFPNRADVLLNLAASYARTERPDDARTLYRKVLARPDEAMDLSGDRIASSHAIARNGLMRVGENQTASR